MAISDVIKLMDEHPLEWEFGEKNPNWRIVTHEKAGIYLKVSLDGWGEISGVDFCHKCGPDLSFWESWSLLRAFRRLQRAKLNTSAANYLKDIERRTTVINQAVGKCPFCKTLAFGCVYMCKCQAATHIACIKENKDSCPSCNYEADLEE